MNIFTLLSLTTVVYAAIGPVSDLEIVSTNISPDGFERQAVLVNGQYPGPLIRGFKGDTFKLNVIDSLTNEDMLTSTSIHWHGLYQAKSAWADGASFVTQCPISEGNSFLYKFQVPDQAGTFWYHSHLSTQYCDGLRGPMVIYDKFDPHRRRYDVDDESTVLTLSEWYHDLARKATIETVFKSTLFNGKGRFVGGPQTDLWKLTVVHGLRYRIRLIATSCEPNWVFSVDGHKFTVIEADGINTRPLVVDSVQIYAAQRYSLILEANQPIDNYWARAAPNLGSQGFEGGINSGIIHYKGAPNAEPTTTQTPSVNPLKETDLRPLEHPGAPGLPVPGGADLVFNMSFSFDFSTFLFTIGNSTFTPPTTPVLLQILSGAKSATDLLPAGNVFVLPPNKIIEINIPGLSIGGPHPFHLHGNIFDVIRSAGSSTYNFENPIRRDVVNTGMDGDLTTIRFVTTNAGPWFFHCHIDWHLDLGLGVIFVADIGQIAKSNPPDSWDDLCPGTYPDRGHRHNGHGIPLIH